MRHEFYIFNIINLTILVIIAFICLVIEYFSNAPHPRHLKRHLRSSVHIMPQDDERFHNLPLNELLHGDRIIPGAEQSLAEVSVFG